MGLKTIITAKISSNSHWSPRNLQVNGSTRYMRLLYTLARPLYDRGRAATLRPLYDEPHSHGPDPAMSTVSQTCHPLVPFLKVQRPVGPWTVRIYDPVDF